jgi:adenylate cyclase
MQAQGSEQAAQGRDTRQGLERNARPGAEETVRSLEPFLRRSAGRKIVTIMAADVVEYGRLMGIDEEGTLAALKVRRIIFDRLAREFDGHEFGCVGDSLMAQFPSAVNAVRCALAIQRAVGVENSRLPAGRHMSLRIGVNLGDVLEEHGTLFGDGVNIAARLQTLASPGGILISNAVLNQVKGKVAACFRSIGFQRLKNISHAISGYEVIAPACETTTAHSKSTRRAGPGSVAVLPFLNLTREWDKESFGDGLAEELIHVLTRVPDLHVPARTSCFSYKGRNIDVRQIASELEVEAVLEGSVRGSGERVRITAQMIDGRTGYHVWSHSFDRRFVDTLRLQHALAAAIVRIADLRSVGGAM